MLRPQKFFVFILYTLVVFATISQAQVSSEINGEVQNQKEVQVKPTAEDVAISARLVGILNATGWFEGIDVKVREGVVFLSGTADTREHWEWAEQLAKKTEAVVAVVNNIAIKEPGFWDLTPKWTDLTTGFVKMLKKIPRISLILLLLIVTWFASKTSVLFVRWALKFRVKSFLLRSVIARTAVIPIFLLGLYLTLHISGLSRLAMTVIGGTGILGLVVGFAFKDIAENFLASILVSVHHPFSKGDLIEVAGYEGYVQGVNSRSTLLLSQQGNFVQIPNATVYKACIINYTANPVTRDEFVIGIGYDGSIMQAQSIALKVLEKHEAVVAEPESFVIVSELASATVNLKILYWFNISKHSRLKVRSSIMRLIKNAFDEAEITMPDDAREVVFPKGVPVQMLDKEYGSKPKDDSTSKEKPNEKCTEANLESESIDIKKQNKQLPNSLSGGNLL